MVRIMWQYSSLQTAPYIELECTPAELVEAQETLTKAQFMEWVQNVASGETHAEAMQEAIEWDTNTGFYSPEAVKAREV